MKHTHTHGKLGVLFKGEIPLAVRSVPMFLVVSSFVLEMRRKRRPSVARAAASSGHLCTLPSLLPFPSPLYFFYTLHATHRENEEQRDMEKWREREEKREEHGPLLPSHTQIQEKERELLLLHNQMEGRNIFLFLFFCCCVSRAQRNTTQCTTNRISIEK